jgi:hypothetical protein
MGLKLGARGLARIFHTYGSHAFLKKSALILSIFGAGQAPAFPVRKTSWRSRFSHYGCATNRQLCLFRFQHCSLPSLCVQRSGFRAWPRENMKGGTEKSEN